MLILDIERGIREKEGEIERERKERECCVKAAAVQFNVFFKQIGLNVHNSSDDSK